MYGLTGYICRRYVNVCGVIWALGAINVNIYIYMYMGYPVRNVEGT